MSPSLTTDPTQQGPGLGAALGASITAFCVVIFISYTEYFAWAFSGRDNEWEPILLASLVAGGIAAVVSGVLALFVRRPVALTLGLLIPLTPFAFHVLWSFGLRADVWKVVALVVTLIPALIVARLVSFRRVPAALFLGAALAFGASWAHHTANQPAYAPVVDASLPNVILLVMDTTRTDFLSVYGYPQKTTPELEEFAADAEVYENAWSTCGWTPPSHASMFTGMLPAEHGVTVPMRTNSPPFPEDRETLARVLGRTGYRTAGYVANRILGTPGWGVDFQEYRLARFSQNHSFVEPLNLVLRGYDSRSREQHRTKHIFERARTWWSQHKKAPRFLFLNLLDPHWPYVPLEEDESFLANLERPPEVKEKNDDLTQLHTDFDPRPFHVRPGLSDVEKKYLAGLYAGELAGMDREIGRFFDWLKAEGDYDNTIIVVTSDHGERLGERGLVGHAVTADPYTLRVPLIIRYPSKIPAARTKRTVQIDGIPGYVLHLAELESPEVMTKSALHNQLDRRVAVAQQEEPDTFLSELTGMDPNLDTKPYRGDWFFIADERFLYAYNIREGEEARGRLTEYIADPDFTKDVSDQFPEKVKQFRAVAENLPRYGGGARSEPDAETLKILRSLGYVR
jgi:arylsulfatase A-like enzyme